MLVLVGHTRPELGGSEYAASRSLTTGAVPRCRPQEWQRRYATIAKLISESLVTAVHAPGRGGLLPALFRMTRAAAAGLEVDLGQAPAVADLGWEALLFAETCGRMLLSCREDRLAVVLDRLEGEPAVALGRWTEAER